MSVVICITFCREMSLTIICLLLFSPISFSEDVCKASKENCEQPETSKIASSVKETVVFYENIKRQIEVAVNEYSECSSKNCSCFYDVLKSDLAYFKSGIMREDVERVRNRGTTYVVFQKRLYRSKDCVFPARCSGVEYFLRKILPKLPNLEFILNSRDWPQISRNFGPKGPVFSFSKTPDYVDIHFPAWSFWEGGPAIKSYPKGIGRWDVLRETLLLANKKFPWDQKIGKGFFRGSRTSDERDTLILLSRAHPDLLDAQYTKNQAWKSPADTLNAEPAEEVPLDRHCQYKYLFNLRGVAASFRFKHLFLCGSLVFHFGEDWTEFFYPSLKPWVHYVPLSAKATQEDILQVIDFFQSHDHLAKDIAERGQKFIEHHLRLNDVQCYWKSLLKRYSKILKYHVSLDPDLVEVV